MERQFVDLFYQTRTSEPGGAIAPKLDYRVQIEFASPKIVDAYLCYKPVRGLNVQLGEYKLPFSIENTDYVPLRYESSNTPFRCAN